MKLLFILLTTLLTNILIAQNPKTYELYNSKGEKVDYNSMINEMAVADVVLFGELHNNSIDHWMELQVAKSLFHKDSLLQIGAEMYESDNQLILDEYMKGYIKKTYFEDEMRLWKNYKTDYKPVLEFAKANNIGFYATNVPRRYAGVVGKKGFEGLAELSDEARSYCAPLPVPFDTLAPNYDEMMTMDTGHGMGISVNFVKAQAIKDATMAYFISKNLKKGYTFLHYQGDFHSKNHGAISWYLNKYMPGLKIVTLSTQESKDLDFKDEYKK
ncbi:MAG TPA: iron-regulated protein, partial [Bacteroidetes bacterium]|nr:iron-regulated protein [Bacteroidota bacterium]